MKRLMAFLLVLAIMVLALGFSVAEEEKPETFESGCWRYMVQEDGTIRILLCTSKDKKITEITVPEEIDGKAVTAIGVDKVKKLNDMVFLFCPLQSIRFPDSITNVGANPLIGCKVTDIQVSLNHPYLATIDGVLFSKPDKRLVCYPRAFTFEDYRIPQGVKIIGDYALSYNTALKRVEIPDSVTIIGERAFNHCDALSEVDMPDSVTSIGSYAFASCYLLSDFHLPANLTSIGEYAFYFCKSLKSIVIPDGVTEIENNAFEQCYSMTSVTISGSVKNIGAEAFGNCGALSELIIYDGVESIGDKAFIGCMKLKSVTIPESVTSIGSDAFKADFNLEAIVTRNSYAEKYCIENGIKYTYSDANDWLND